ncbi:MAG TPA: CpaD family pilus assembly protein [Methyloceanibacter sp.]|nr:CpaD family pilus assembly protein [Methyloceanibacter sp.]
MEGIDIMVSSSQGSRIVRPLLTIFAVLLVGTTTGGCWKSPRYQSPFTLANPNERHPIAVRQGEVVLDLAVYPGSSGLNESQKGQVYGFLRDYKSQSSERLLIRAPSGGANEAAAMRAYDDVREALRNAGIRASAVRLEPYFANGDPSAPMRLSYLQFVAEPPECPDWSENIGRDPKNMPWPNKGCATQRNLAAMVANPEDLLHPRGETPRSGERRDVVWGKYVKGEVTGSKWGPGEKPLSEHATTNDVAEDD